MKGFFYRLIGVVKPGTEPREDNVFHVTLGELRAQLGHDPYPRTDDYTLAVKFEPDQDEVQKSR